MKVFVANDRNEAHVVRSVLESHGIATELRPVSLFGVSPEPETAFSEGFAEVWVVNDQQVGEALDVLRDRSSEAGDVPKGQSWRCAVCGEMLEPQFTACWQCNAENVAPS